MNTGSGDTQYIAGLPIDSPAMFMVAAHELKSPLSLIRQLALALEGGDVSAAECERLYAQIRLTSERALRLTSDVTRSVRAGETLFDLEPLNPLNLCDDVAHELAPLYKAHGRTIAVQHRTQAPLVVANRDLLRRVLLNFGDNALHYAGDHMPVELSVRSHQERVRVGVRDYGPALSADSWRTLQGRLAAQAPQALHSRPQSSGLGLSIARHFAELMNGTVGAVRHRDGATFYVDVDASHQMSLL